MNQATDEALAARFLAGDVSSFEQLVDRYSKPIFNFALRFLGDYDDASDVAQSVFVQAFIYLPKARIDQPLKPWLFQIARNKSIDLLRARRQVRFSDLTLDDDDLSQVDNVPDSSPLPEELFERADLQRTLSAAIASLPVKYREVVALRYTSDLTFREMGDSLGLPENSVKTLFQRAKVHLRKFLEHEI